MKRLHKIGPTIGSFLGKPIFKKLEDRDGSYIFDRIARYEDEGYSLHQLAKNEIFVAPALIYKRIP